MTGGGRERSWRNRRRELYDAGVTGGGKEGRNEAGEKAEGRG